MLLWNRKIGLPLFFHLLLCLCLEACAPQKELERESVAVESSLAKQTESASASLTFVPDNTAKHGDRVAREARLLASLQPPDSPASHAGDFAGNNSPSFREHGYKTVILLAPFTSQEESGENIGENLMNAATLALFDNADMRLNILSLDSHSDLAETVQIAYDNRAEAIIGPITATRSQALVDILQANTTKSPPIIFSLSNSIELDSDSLYRMGFAPEGQIRTLMRYVQKIGKKRIAIMTPNNAYGHKIVALAYQYAAHMPNLQITSTSLYPSDTTNFRDYVNSLSNQRGQFDSILIAAIKPQSLKTIASQLDSANLAFPNVQLMGLQAWDRFPNLQHEPSLNNAIWVSARGSAWTQFKHRYQKIFTQTPHPLAAITYDTLAMLINLQKNKTTKQSFAGLNGIFHLTNDGQVKRNYTTIKHIKQKQIHSLKLPP